MRWYTFNDEGTDTINLLLDHNTTATVAWVTKEDYVEAGGTVEEYGSVGNTSKGPITALKQLKSDTSTWNKSINPRLIEASEIATITGNSGLTAGGSYYYFHTNSTTKYTGAAGTNKYAWLFDNTYNCTTYGCNVADSSAGAYWTNTADSGSFNTAFTVYYIGVLRHDNSVANASGPGVRPVITVSRDKLR